MGKLSGFPQKVWNNLEESLPFVLSSCVWPHPAAARRVGTTSVAQPKAHNLVTCSKPFLLSLELNPARQSGPASYLTARRNCAWMDAHSTSCHRSHKPSSLSPCSPPAGPRVPTPEQAQSFHQNSEASPDALLLLFSLRSARSPGKPP